MGRRAAGLFRRAALRMLLLVLIAIAAVGGIFLYFQLSSPTFRDALGVLVSRSDTPEKAFPGQDEVNILLMGKDQDRDPQGQIVHTRGRTDVMMLAHIDFRSRTANVLSIPRDTLVHIPGYAGKRRVSYANALGGPELAKDTVSGFLGVRPDYYLLVDFASFEKAIDAIGGLEVTVDKKLDYDDNWGNLHIHLEPGRRVLNGEQAMGFARYRQSNDGDAESDFVRIGRQQELLRAAKDKLRSPAAAFRVPKVLDTIRNDAETDLTPAQMICLARFVKSLPQNEGVRMETLPTLEGDGVFVEADPDAARDLVGRMFFGDGLPH